MTMRRETRGVGEWEEIRSADGSHTFIKHLGDQHEVWVATDEELDEHDREVAATALRLASEELHQYAVRKETELIDRGVTTPVAIRYANGIRAAARHLWTEGEPSDL